MLSRHSPMQVFKLRDFSPGGVPLRGMISLREEALTDLTGSLSQDEIAGFDYGDSLLNAPNDRLPRGSRNAAEPGPKDYGDSLLNAPNDRQPARIEKRRRT